MNRFTRLLSLVSLGALLTSGALAQSNPGFTGTNDGTPITATTGGVTGPLPSGGSSIVVSNTGSNAVYCKLGDTATTSSQYIASGSWFQFQRINQTTITCITATSTTVVNIVAGAGQATGAGGGGSGGGGGGGSVTQGTVPWIVAGQGTAGTAATGVVTVQGIAAMTPLLVTPSALPANQSVNVAQINGVTTLTGAGATGTGSQRVTAAQDTTTIAGSAPGTAGTASANVVTVQGVASMTKLLVTPDSVALPANQSVNVAQINGVTPLMGNGVTGTGSPRVTIASDNTAFNVLATTSPGARTLVTLDVKTITTGGTAVTALTSGHKSAGGWIQNPPSATINLCINEIGTATGTTTSGDTTCIIPGQTYNLVPSSGTVSVISSDSSHPFGGYGFQ